MFILPHSSRVAVCLAAVTGFAISAEASMIANGDFEAAKGDPLAPVGWRHNNADNTGFNYLTTGGPDGEGDAYVQIHGRGNPGSAGARWISPRTEIEAEASYTLDLDYLGQSQSFYVRIDFFNGNTYKTAVELFDRKEGNLPSFDPATTWTHKQFEFTAPAGVDRFEVVLRKNDWGGTASADNVVVAPVSVPEPGTMGALAAGLSLTGLRRR